MGILKSLYRRLRGVVAPLVEQAVAQIVCLRGSKARQANRIENSLQRRFGVYISSQTQIGTGLALPHSTGIVIGAGARLDNGVATYHNVTLGVAGQRETGDDRYLDIGDGVTIFSGAVLLRNIRVGRGCVIGANSMVLSDVPDGTTEVGLPARILSPSGLKN